MKWYIPKIRTTKKVSKFLFLPITIGRETRWLEWAEIEYIYDYSYGTPSTSLCWQPYKFID